MTEQMYDENEVLVSEKDGVYTIDIWVTENREIMLSQVIWMLLVWPVAITGALLALVWLKEAYYVITIPALILSVLLIVPIVLVIRMIAKRYHREYEFEKIKVPVEVKNNRVYMNGKKVKIKYNFEEDGFDIYNSKIKSFSVDRGVTEEFRTFLENKRIPYC